MGSYSTSIIPKQCCYGREFPLVEMKGSPSVPCLGVCLKVHTVWPSENSSLWWSFGNTHTLSTTIIEKIHGTPPYILVDTTIWYTPSINLPKLVMGKPSILTLPPKVFTVAIHQGPCLLSTHDLAVPPVIWVEKRDSFPLEECPIYGGFLKWWYPTTIGLPTKNDHFEVWNGGTTI